MGLAAPSGSGIEELVHIESLLPFKNVVGSPSELMSKDREGLGLAVFFLEPFFVFHTFGVSPEEEDGGFGESPLEVGVTDFLVGCAMTFPGGFPGRFNETAIGDEVLDCWEAAYVVDFIKDDERENGSDAVDGFQEKKGVGIVFCGVTMDVYFEVPLDSIEMIDEFEISFDALSDGRIGEMLGNTLAMDFIGNLFAELGKVTLAVGVLDVAQEIGTFTHEVVVSAQEIAGSAHTGRVNVSFRDHSGA